MLHRNDPSLGRFLQPDPFVQDPADPQMLNRYSYVRNNPLNFVDPSGYRRGWFRRLIAAVAAVVVAVVVTVALGGPENPVAVGVGIAAGAATYTAISGSERGSASSSSSSSAEAASPRGPPSPAPAAAPSPLGHAASFLSPVRYTDAGKPLGNPQNPNFEAAKVIVQNLGVSSGLASEAIIQALTIPEQSILGRYRVGDTPQLFRNDPVIYEDIQLRLGAEIFPGKAIVPRGFSTGEAYAGSTMIRVYGDPITQQPSSWFAAVRDRVGSEPSVGWPIYGWRVVEEQHARNLSITYKAEWYFQQRKR